MRKPKKIVENEELPEEFQEEFDELEDNFIEIDDDEEYWNLRVEKCFIRSQHHLYNNFFYLYTIFPSFTMIFSEVQQKREKRCYLGVFLGVST
ncbi:hypothetical protein ES705_21618 [subsurface metagenome]